jgi:hypothetical protein
MTGLTTPTMTETVSGIFIDLLDPKVEDIQIHDIAWALSRQSRYAGHTMCKIPYTVAQHTVLVSKYVEEALTPGTHLYEVFEKYIQGKMDKTANLSDETEFGKWASIQDRQRDASRMGHVRMYAFHGLMHDFAEAYLVDLPTPVKRLPGIYDIYKKYELMMDALIYKAFNLGYGPRGIMSLGDIQHPLNWEFGLAVVGWADAYALLMEAYHFMPSRGLNWNIPLERPSLSQIYNFRWPIPNEEAYKEVLARFEEVRTPDPVY